MERKRRLCGALGLINIFEEISQEVGDDFKMR
jgi:hypothetical protein